MEVGEEWRGSVTWWVTGGSRARFVGASESDRLYEVRGIRAESVGMTPQQEWEARVSVLAHMGSARLTGVRELRPAQTYIWVCQMRQVAR